MRNTHRTVRRCIGDEVREFEGLAKGGDTVKGPRPKTVGKTGECDEAGVLRGAHPNGTDMDNDNTNYKGSRGVYRDRLSGSHM